MRVAGTEATGAFHACEADDVLVRTYAAAGLSQTCFQSRSAVESVSDRLRARGFPYLRAFDGVGE